MNEFKPRTTTTPRDTEQIITFTQAETGTGKPLRCVRKTSRKRDPQRTEKRKEREQRRETDKIIDGIVKEANRGNEDEDGDEEPGEQTSTPIDTSNEDASTAAEAHQLLVEYLEHQQWCNEIQDELDQHN